VTRQGGEVEGRKESAVWATRECLMGYENGGGVVSLIRFAIDVELRRAERRRAFFQSLNASVTEKRRNALALQSSTMHSNTQTNPTSLAKSIAMHPTVSSFLPLPVVVPDETSHVHIEMCPRRRVGG